MAIYFQGLEGYCSGQTFEFENDVVLGRGLDCDVTVSDPCCSRQHVRIERGGSGYQIRDLGSRNGVVVNGKRVQKKTLRYGDRFSIGNSYFIFLSQVLDGHASHDSSLITVDVADIERRMTEDLSEAAETFHAGKIRSASEGNLESLWRTQEHLSTVRRTSQLLNGTLDRETLLESLAQNLFKEFHSAARVSIFLAGGSCQSELEEVKYLSRDVRDYQPVSTSILNRVVSERVGLLSENLGNQQRHAFMCVSLAVGERLVGAIYVESQKHHGGFDKSDLELLTLICNQAATALSNTLLYEESQISFFETVRSLGKALEAKDEYTQGHGERVARYSVGIGKKLGLADEDLKTLRVAAELHDIGKIAIEDRIIGKNGALTDEEFAAVRRHPELGVEILRPIHFLESTLPLILHHHERYDGSGYPAGLKGEEIPLGARIINLADAFDAMTTSRSYNRPVGMIEAIHRCREEAGKSFDERCVAAFVQHLEAGHDSSMAMTISYSGDLATAG